MIADANHGYKMIGVGELVAKEILGQESELLKPFRFNRYEKGELHPTSNLSLIHISEPTRRYAISYAVFCLKKFIIH